LISGYATGSELLCLVSLVQLLRLAGGVQERPAACLTDTQRRGWKTKTEMDVDTRLTASSLQPMRMLVFAAVICFATAVLSAEPRKSVLCDFLISSTLYRLINMLT